MRDKNKCDHDPFLDVERGEYTCQECGLVLNDKILVDKNHLPPEIDDKTSKSSKIDQYFKKGAILGSVIDFSYSEYFHNTEELPISAHNQTLYRLLRYPLDSKAQVVHQRMENSNKNDIRTRSKRITGI